MILLRRLELENFLSHEATSLSFGNSEKLLIDGTSGSGKSSIVEAIVWCLYGVGRVDNRFLVRKGAKKAVVTIVLSEGEDEYKIVRTATSKGGHTIEVFKGKTHIDRAGIRDIQDWIENELLHASYTLFTNSVAYLQDNPDIFVRQSATKRKELLLEIVNAKEFDVLYKKASEALSANAIEYAKNETSCLILTGEVDRLAPLVSSERLEGIKVERTAVTERIMDRKNSIEVFNDHIAKITKVESEIEKNNITIVSLKDRLKSNELIIDTCSKKITLIAESKKKVDSLSAQVVDLSAMKERFKSLSALVEKEQERILKMSFVRSSVPDQSVDYFDKLARIDKQLETLQKDTTKCPSGDKCPYTTPIMGQIAFLTHEKAKVEELVVKLTKSLLEHSERLKIVCIPLMTDTEIEEHKEIKKVLEHKNEIERELEKTQAYMSGFDEAENGLMRMTALGTIASDGAVIVGLQEKNLELTAQIAMYSSIPQLIESRGKRVIELQDLTEKLISIESDYKMYQSNVVAQKKAVDALGDAISASFKIKKETKALEAIKEAFGSRGVPAIVVDYLTPRLEERINEILAQLSDFRIRIDTQRKNSSDDGMVEGLFLTIYNDSGEEMDFDAYSGGQKLKISVAISEALASLQKIGFRIFDEAIVGLDDQSIEGFTEVMEKLNSRFNQVICISHLRNVKDLFETKITVTRPNGVSIINND